MRLWSVLWLGGLMGVGLAEPGEASGQSVRAVPKLDLNRFATGWYEVARLPNKPQKKCVSDAFQMVALGNKPGRFQLVQSCLLKDGETNTRSVAGKMDKLGDGKLKLSTLPLFLLPTKLWVMATGPDFEWALVGSPNHKLLWVLSRKAKMDAAVLQQVEAVAEAQGFKTGKLVMVAQDK